MRRLRVGAILLLGTTLVAAADTAPARKPKQALKAFNDLIGEWRVTGEPAGTPAERRKNFWTEKAAWEWRFQNDDAWLVATFDSGKHFRSAKLRYVPAKDGYALEATTPTKETRTFEGTLDDRKLTLERHDEAANEDQRLIVRVLHFNRYLVRYETRPAGKTNYALAWELGCTKEGVPFAYSDDGPECVVSGGLGTIPVTYKGTTYYVCCTGCRDAFKEEPEKYIKEFELRKKKKE